MKIYFATLCAAAIVLTFSLVACQEHDDSDDSCPRQGVVCAEIYAPVCVQQESGKFCAQPNSCYADANCDTNLCRLNLDGAGAIDPATVCAKDHPDCVNPCR